MTVALTSPVTGGAQTGLTSPTYTHAQGTAADVNGKLWYVTSLGGTQTNVTVHSAASPFTLGYWVPKVLRFLGKPNPTTGLIASVPMNVHRFQLRKGVLVLAGQPYQVMDATVVIKIPAGADLADPANIRAGLSMLVGGISQLSAGIGDTCVTGLS
jgi:hypothetical protein